MPEVPIRPASTVMLLRDSEAGPEVYLLQRVAQMAFAGGMTAFPGGGVDARDAAPIGWQGPAPDWWATQFGADVELAGSVVVAAVRELFEEVGVLLVDLPTPAPDGAALAESRRRIVDHQIGLDTVVGEGSIRADRLRPWARWVTPAGQSRRYDTFFLLALLPDGAEARMLTTEAEAGQWMRPDEALGAATRGEIAMMPPTVAMLTELAAFSSTAQLLEVERTIETVAPQPISRSGEPMRVLVAGTEFGALGMSGMTKTGTVIASGRDTEILEYGSGLVLRRPLDRRSLAGEAAVMRWVRDQGYPCPAVAAVVDDGLVIQRLDGVSMLDDLLAHPDRISLHTRTLAGLHRQLHDLPLSAGLPDLPRYFGDGDSLLHADLHPGNVLLTADGPVVIDWANATIGPAGADVAMTWLLMAAADLPDDGDLRAGMLRFRQAFLDEFLAAADRRGASAYLSAVLQHRRSDPNLSAAELAVMADIVQRFGT